MNESSHGALADHSHRDTDVDVPVESSSLHKSREKASEKPVKTRESGGGKSRQQEQLSGTQHTSVAASTNSPPSTQETESTEAALLTQTTQRSQGAQVSQSSHLTQVSTNPSISEPTQIPSIGHPHSPAKSPSKADSQPLQAASTSPDRGPLRDQAKRPEQHEPFTPRQQKERSPQSQSRPRTQKEESEMKTTPRQPTPPPSLPLPPQQGPSSLHAYNTESVHSVTSAGANFASEAAQKGKTQRSQNSSQTLAQLPAHGSSPYHQPARGKPPMPLPSMGQTFQGHLQPPRLATEAERVGSSPRSSSQGAHPTQGMQTAQPIPSSRGAKLFQDSRAVPPSTLQPSFAAQPQGSSVQREAIDQSPLPPRTLDETSERNTDIMQDSPRHKFSGPERSPQASKPLSTSLNVPPRMVLHNSQPVQRPTGPQTPSTDVQTPAAKGADKAMNPSSSTPLGISQDQQQRTGHGTPQSSSAPLQLEKRQAAPTAGAPQGVPDVQQGHGGVQTEEEHRHMPPSGQGPSSRGASGQTSAVQNSNRSLQPSSLPQQGSEHAPRKQGGLKAPKTISQPVQSTSPSLAVPPTAQPTAHAQLPSGISSQLHSTPSMSAKGSLPSQPQKQSTPMRATLPNFNSPKQQPLGSQGWSPQSTAPPQSGVSPPPQRATPLSFIPKQQNQIPSRTPLGNYLHQSIHQRTQQGPTEQGSQKTGGSAKQHSSYGQQAPQQQGSRYSGPDKAPGMLQQKMSGLDSMSQQPSPPPQSPQRKQMVQPPHQIHPPYSQQPVPSKPATEAASQLSPMAHPSQRTPSAGHIPQGAQVRAEVALGTCL